MREINQSLFDAAFVNGKVTDIEDCRKIRNFARELGIFMTLKQAEVVWDYYSGVRDAQWLGIPGGWKGKEKVTEAIREFIVERLGEL